MQRSFAVVAPGKQVPVLLALLTLVLPLGSMTGVLAYAGWPEEAAARWTLGCVFALVLALGIGLLLCARRLGIELQRGRLLVRATLYTLRVEPRSLDLDAARIVSLARHPELKPRLKSNGFALPGLYAGHFRGWPLSQRFFCLLTGHDNVLVLPEHGGRMLLLSPQRPQALLDALRAVRG